MSNDVEWTNCPICNRPLNPDDHNESVYYNGEIIHAACVEVADRRQRQDRNPNNSDT
jgi:hypothetical protein